MTDVKAVSPTTPWRTVVADRVGVRYDLDGGAEGEEASAALAAHLARLSARSRRLRFGYQIGENALAAMAAPETGRLLLLLRDAAGETRGAVTLHPVDTRTVELGVSVEDALQGRGLGRALFEAALARAEAAGFERMLVICLPENHAMRRLVALGQGETRMEDELAIAWLVVDQARAALAADTRARRIVSAPERSAPGFAALPESVVAFALMPFEIALLGWRLALWPFIGEIPPARAPRSYTATRSSSA